jgi:hypothetical protein
MYIRICVGEASSFILILRLIFATKYPKMNLRQRLQVLLILLFTFFAFASYHPDTGSTAWMQWGTVVVILFFTFVFDLAFTDDSNFLFDPDADNWRRKTEAGQY